MASQTPLSIENMPSEMVASILGQLDTVKQLKVAVSSHSIFHDAFKENVRSTIRSVITNEISEDILPFSLAVFGTSRADQIGTQSVSRVMTTLNDRINNPTMTSEYLATFTLSNLEALRKTNNTVKCLGEMFCKDSLPLFRKSLGPEFTYEPGPRDDFRIHRALYRYKIMCNLLCNYSSRREKFIETDRSEVFGSFPPWVNEQLLCIYFYLQRTVMEVHDDVAVYDVNWNEVGVSWSDEQWWIDGMEFRVQRYLKNGLEFIKSIAEAETSEERADLIYDAENAYLDTKESSPTVDEDSSSPHEHIVSLPYYSTGFLIEDLDFDSSLAKVNEMLLDGLDRIFCQSS